MNQCIPDVLSIAMIGWAALSLYSAVASGRTYVRSFSPQNSREHWMGRECLYRKEPFIFALALTARCGVIVICTMALMRIPLS